MKQIKRLLSLTLVAVMVLGMFSMVASADEIVGRVENAEGLTELPFEKKVTIANDGTLPTATFTFDMEPVTVTDGVTDSSGTKVQSGVGSKITTTVEFTNADMSDTSKAVANTDTGLTTVTKEVKFNLSSLNENFAKTGVYRYKVTEEAGTDNHYTYDTSTSYTVDLYVTKDDSGAKITTIQAFDSNNSKAPIEFTNHCKTANLIIKKYIEGSNADANEEFTFYIKIPKDGEALDITNGTVTAKKFDKTGAELTDEDDKVTIKVDGTKAEKTDDTVTEYWNEFTLKGGEYLELYGLPEGMIYWVKEVDYSGEGYKTYSTVVTGSNEENGATYSTETKNETDQRTIVAGNNIVLFKNVRDIPNTGLTVNVIPYVLGMLVAVCGIALFVVRKKRAVR